MTNVKWVSTITVVTEPFAGYQVASGYRFRQSEDEEGRPVTPDAAALADGAAGDTRVRDARAHPGRRPRPAPGPCVVRESADRTGRGEHGRRLVLGRRGADTRPRGAVGMVRLVVLVGRGRRRARPVRRAPRTRPATPSPSSPSGISAATRTTPCSASPSSSADDGPRGVSPEPLASFGAMTRRVLAWLLVTPLAAAGILVAHAAAYSLTGTPTGAVHAYLDHVPQIVAILATVGLVGLALQQRGVGSRSLWTFALAAPAGFACQEHVERLDPHGRAPVAPDDAGVPRRAGTAGARRRPLRPRRPARRRDARLGSPGAAAARARRHVAAGPWTCRSRVPARRVSPARTGRAPPALLAT